MVHQTDPHRSFNSSISFDDPNMEYSKLITNPRANVPLLIENLKSFFKQNELTNYLSELPNFFRILCIKISDKEFKKDNIHLFIQLTNKINTIVTSYLLLNENTFYQVHQIVKKSLTVLEVYRNKASQTYQELVVCKNFIINTQDPTKKKEYFERYLNQIISSGFILELKLCFQQFTKLSYETLFNSIEKIEENSCYFSKKEVRTHLSWLFKQCSYTGKKAEIFFKYLHESKRQSIVTCFPRHFIPLIKDGKLNIFDFYKKKYVPQFINQFADWLLRCFEKDYLSEDFYNDFFLENSQYKFLFKLNSFVGGVEIILAWIRQFKEEVNEDDYLPALADLAFCYGFEQKWDSNRLKDYHIDLKTSQGFQTIYRWAGYLAKTEPSSLIKLFNEVFGDLDEQEDLKYRLDVFNRCVSNGPLHVNFAGYLSWFKLENSLHGQLALCRFLESKTQEKNFNLFNLSRINFCFIDSEARLTFLKKTLRNAAQCGNIQLFDFILDLKILSEKGESNQWVYSSRWIYNLLVLAFQNQTLKFSKKTPMIKIWKELRNPSRDQCWNLVKVCIEANGWIDHRLLSHFGIELIEKEWENFTDLLMAYSDTHLVTKKMILGFKLCIQDYPKWINILRDVILRQFERGYQDLILELDQLGWDTNQESQSAVFLEVALAGFKYFPVFFNEILGQVLAIPYAKDDPRCRDLISYCIEKDPFSFLQHYLMFCRELSFDFIRGLSRLSLFFFNGKVKFSEIKDLYSFAKRHNGVLALEIPAFTLAYLPLVAPEGYLSGHSFDGFPGKAPWTNAVFNFFELDQGMLHQTIMDIYIQVKLRYEHSEIDFEPVFNFVYNEMNSYKKLRKLILINALFVHLYYAKVPLDVLKKTGFAEFCNSLIVLREPHLQAYLIYTYFNELIPYENRIRALCDFNPNQSKLSHRQRLYDLLLATYEHDPEIGRLRNKIESLKEHCNGKGQGYWKRYQHHHALLNLLFALQQSKQLNHKNKIQLLKILLSHSKKMDRAESKKYYQLIVKMTSYVLLLQERPFEIDLQMVDLSKIDAALDDQLIQVSMKILQFNDQEAFQEEGKMDKLKQWIHSFQNQGTFFVLLSKLNLLDHIKKNEAFCFLKVILQHVINGDFYDWRYEENKHLAIAFKKGGMKESWKKNHKQEVLINNKPCTVEISDNPLDIMVAATEVEGSCQTIYGRPEFIFPLLTNIADGKILLIAIKDSRGSMLARAYMKLLLSEQDGSGVVFLEKFYPLTKNPEYIRILMDMALIKSKEVDLPLVFMEEASDREIYEDSLESKGCRGPEEYVDANEWPYSGGVYTIASGDSGTLYVIK